MKHKNILVAMLIVASAPSFATGAYTMVDPMQGTTAVGKETRFKISYKWLSTGDRNGKIVYLVPNTSCNGQIAIDTHTKLIPVSGEVVIKCKFDKSAVFNATTMLQLYDGVIVKEYSDIKHGKIAVTVE